MTVMNRQNESVGSVPSPLAAADSAHADASRKFAWECRNLARTIAKFMEQYDLQATLKNGVSYRVLRVTWGVPCMGSVCVYPDNRLVLLRNGRIINNERREWVCGNNVKHEANRCKYIFADEPNKPVAQLGSFSEMELFLDEAPELQENCKRQVEELASRLRARAEQARGLNEQQRAEMDDQQR